jgi:glycosyltransferase involved in cell wall biosynthesis
MQERSKLIIFNFAMDVKSPLLSHQAELAQALASKFSHVTVISGSVGEFNSKKNLHVIDTGWRPGKSIRNIIHFYHKSLPVILCGDYDAVFFHMTDLQCFLISPLVKLKNKKQALWYAHTSKSKYLAWCMKWVDLILTSTSGSFPITCDKVTTIGQAIDSDKFKPISQSQLNFSRLIHIGRFDRAKNVDLLISEAIAIKSRYPEVKLTIIGSPGNKESQEWANELMNANASEGSWLRFKSAIPRESFATEISKNGVFFHAYLGSLDKTLIESTFLRVPVVSINPEYLKIFGSWSGTSAPNLVDEYQTFRLLSNEEISLELDRRRELALKHHSLSNWTSKVYSLFN